MIMNMFKTLINKINNIFTDSLKDPRYKDYVDRPICSYPKECSSMKLIPTCYNCKYSVYSAGPEYCEL